MSRTGTKPPPLAPDAVVEVVAPSSCFDREPFDRGMGILRDAGLAVRAGEAVFARQGYLAGEDSDRAAALMQAWETPDAGALVCARGGFGSLRLLPLLDLERLARAPRLFAGFSDATALLALLTARLGISAIHAPVVTHLGLMDPAVARDAAHSLAGLLAGRPAFPLAADPSRTLFPGTAQGRVLGGNLTTLCHLAGTPFAPDFSGAILFLEDFGEAPYRLDRMLTHLGLSGMLDGVAGVALGSFTQCGDEAEVLRVLTERLVPLSIPVAAGFPAGHGPVNLPFPLGVFARLDANAGVLEFLEPLTA
ncbi:MAG: LD-carboxypeptidase [Pseudomonadota bacterium]